MASDSLRLWLNMALSRRYTVLVKGDPMPDKDNPGPYMIMANNPALIDPLLVYSCFAHMRPRPVIDHEGLRVLRPFSAWMRPLKKSADDADGAALVSGIVDVLGNKESVLLWPAGRLQTEGVDVLAGRDMAYNALRAMRERGLPLPELILVRVEGMWGSRFSRYGCEEGEPALTGTLARLLPWLCLGPLLPRRPVNIVLRRHLPGEADMSGPESLNHLLSGWFNARQHSASIVPLAPGMPAQNLPLTPQKGGRKKPAPIPKPAPPDPIPPAPPKPDVPDIIDQNIADKMAAAQAAQKERAETDFLLKKARLVAPPRLPVHLAAARQGDVWDGAAGHMFSRRDILGFSKALGRKLGKASGLVGVALPAGAPALAAFLCCLDNEAAPLFLPVGMPTQAWQGWADAAGVSQAIVNAEDLINLPDGITPVLWEDFGKSALRRGYMSSFAGLAGTEDVGAPAAALPEPQADFSARVFTHEMLLDGLEALIAALSVHNIKELSIFTSMPPCTPLGLAAGVALPLACGLPLACAPREGLAQAAASCGCNMFVGSGEDLRAMLEAAENLPPLRCAIVDESEPSGALAGQLRRKCPDAVLLRAEGLISFVADG